jgi:hypothetical protein
MPLIAVSGPLIGALIAILWIALFIFLGVTCIRKGHWVMFIIGIFIFPFWIIGALLPPRR